MQDLFIPGGGGGAVSYQASDSSSLSHAAEKTVSATAAAAQPPIASAPSLPSEGDVREEGGTGHRAKAKIKKGSPKYRQIHFPPFPCNLLHQLYSGRGSLALTLIGALLPAAVSSPPIAQDPLRQLPRNPPQLVKQRRNVTNSLSQARSPLNRSTRRRAG